MKIEHRHSKAGGIRASTTDDGLHVITLRPIVPYEADDYGSVWMPDVFDESLEERLPTLAWAHNWDEPIGRGIAWRKVGEVREIDFRLDDFDAVPLARRAFVQCSPGPNGEPPTIDDCSVGFSNTTRRPPTDEELERWDGAREVMIRSALDEVSPVLRGAVHGAKILAVRSRDGRVASVSEDVVMDVARKVAAGEMAQDVAEAYLSLVAVDTAPPVPVEDPNPQVDTIDVDQALAEADAALDGLLDR